MVTELKMAPTLSAMVQIAIRGCQPSVSVTPKYTVEFEYDSLQDMVTAEVCLITSSSWVKSSNLVFLDQEVIAAMPFQLTTDRVVEELEEVH